MNAKEAKEKALAAKSQEAESTRLKKKDLFNSQVSTLLEDLHKKIETAANKGNLSIDKVSYPADRFPQDVITEVSNQLQEEGFSMSLGRHNAFNMLEFMISWVE